MSGDQTLLERERELEVLSGLTGDIVSQGGRVVLIRGEAGIGKTTLVKTFLDRISDSAHVMFGRCDDLLTPRPLDPFWDIARQEPSLREPLEEGNRSELMEAVRDLLERSLRPTVMTVEDTQWADEATLDVISFLGRRIGDTNGLLLLTYRDGEVDVDHPLRVVMGRLPAQRVVRIRLGGLSLAAISSLIAGRGLEADQVMVATDGNPFLAIEMAAAEGEGIPTSVQDSVMARARNLSDRAQQTLRLLSVIPGRLSIEEVNLLLGEAADHVAECEQRGFLYIDDGFVMFRHDLIRQAVEASLTGSDRVAMNRRVLHSLPADTDPARLAHHAREANDIDRLLDLAPRAARAAVTAGSHREAVQQFRLLAPHVGRLDPLKKGSILDDWAQEESIADNMSEAIRLNELALAHYREIHDVNAESGALVAAAQFHEWSGQRERAEDFARRAIEVLGPDGDGAALASALDVNTYLALMAYDAPTAVQLVDRTLEAAGDDIDEDLLVRCLVHRGAALNIIHYPDGKQTLDRARERADAQRLGGETWRALINHADPAVENFDLDTATEYVQMAIAAQVRYGRSSGEAYGKAMYARVLELRGEWTQAEDLAREVLDTSPINRMIALSVLGKIEVRKARSTARATLGQAWQMAADSGEIQRMAPAAGTLAEGGWILGDAAIPVAEIKKVMSDGLDIGMAWLSGLIAFWLWKSGELAEAPDGIAEPYRLVMTGDPAAAAEKWAELGCPYERAIALSHGDTQLQLQALEILEDLEATAVAAKLRQELREQGVAVPRGRARETRAHPVGLTPRQDEVLALLAEGLSNVEIADRLFLSPRTVEHHVTAILSKLNVSTREAAVRVAADRGLLVPT